MTSFHQPPPKHAENSDSSEEGCNYDDDTEMANDLSSNVATSTDGQTSTIAKKETKDVVRIKLIALAVLICAAVGVATSVYVYLTNSENEQFRHQFEGDSHKILEAVGRSLDRTLGLFDSIAVTMVSTAALTNQTWPFVTIPDFAVRMSKLLPLSDAITVYIAPIVTPEQREEWENYTIHNDGWVDEGVAVQDAETGSYFGPVIYNGTKQGVIHGDFEVVPENVSRVMLPLWQNYPVVPNSTYTYNWDVLSITYNDGWETCIREHKAVFTEPYMIPAEDDIIGQEETKLWAESFRNYIGPDEVAMEPMSDFGYPIIQDVSRVSVAGAEDYNPSHRKIVGVAVANMYWRALIRGILPAGSRGIQIVFSNPCTAEFTYQINGPFVTYLGVGDKHDTKYDGDELTFALSELGDSDVGVRARTYSGAKLSEFCPITLHVFPSDIMRADHTTWNPLIFTVAVLLIFAFVSFVLYFYDQKVEHRQETVMSTAVRSTAIVSSLFPTAVCDRLYQDAAGSGVGTKKSNVPATAKGKLTTFLRENHKPIVTDPEADGGSAIVGLPIAELYPETTVLFADISGFTAWSSERSPTQVFYLLESVYSAFDAIAKRRGVFKVETIGDCYVAVVGLPKPRKQHALVMARFARDCREKMLTLVVDLEKTLGPGTADLAMRFGLNSGPTTAGVLRGEKARFQLFGDTVNTAARMESNGQRNKIQVSQKTAELISMAGKGHWLTERTDKVDCKGKGMMTTFWVEPSSLGGSVFSASEDTNNDDHDEPSDPYSAKLKRLIEWNVDVFSGLLTKIAATREANGSTFLPDAESAPIGDPIAEVKEQLPFPSLVPVSQSGQQENTVNPVVLEQLHGLITLVATSYRQNAFHNVDHCSHVVMSTKKLLDRIQETDLDLHQGFNTKGITTSPLTQFAILFAALIHDVDHGGVSNAQLIDEQDPLALAYHGKSVAEQNSVDVAWIMFLRPEFDVLRSWLLATKAESSHFRAVVVNAVMATDLFDKNLKALQETRWTKSFHSVLDESVFSQHAADSESNLRLTIVLTLIIQASDVSHTMQHFTVYKKWNMKLLTEMYTAYQNGRMAKDPMDGWYDGELWFFDNYVIPLAQKLRECQVFGVSCDEFLDFAKDNRLEWELKGRDIVAQAKMDLQGAALQERQGRCTEI